MLRRNEGNSQSDGDRTAPAWAGEALTASAADTAASHRWRALLIRTGCLHAAVAFAVLIPVGLWLAGEPFPLVPDRWLTPLWWGLFLVQLSVNLSSPMWFAAFSIFILVTAMRLVPELGAAMESDAGSIPVAALWTALLAVAVVATALRIVRLAVRQRAGAVLVCVAVLVGLLLVSLALLAADLVFGLGSSVFLLVAFLAAIVLTTTVLGCLTGNSNPWREAVFFLFAASQTFSALL